MKQLTLLVLLLLLSVPVLAQKKKGKETPADSLNRVNATLTAQLDSMTVLYSKQALVLDSVSKKLAPHLVMYTAVKEKVMKRDFDPAKSGVMIDSLQADREATLAGYTTRSKVMTDSIAQLKAENVKLQSAIQTEENRMLTNEEAVHDLELLKNMLDQKILTQAEFDQRKAKLMMKWK